MSFNIRLSENFKKEAKRLSKKYPSLKNEIDILGKELSQNSTIGIPLGNDVFKIRIAIKSKGRRKSGGGRVITFVKTDLETVLLLSIYSKGEKDTITNAEIRDLLKEFL
jgi:mRNA-degrading endonuclease RelE of RelBE toxin-antitoxin system